MSIILSDYDAGLARFMNTEFTYTCCMCDKENVPHMIAFGVNVQHYCDQHWEEARKGIIAFFNDIEKSFEESHLKDELNRRKSDRTFNEQRIKEIEIRLNKILKEKEVS